MAIEVQIRPGAKPVATKQCLQHAHDFGALLIDRRRVEVRDFYVAVRPDGVRHRAGVFGILHAAQKRNVFHPFDRCRRHIRRKLSIAEDRKAFLQAQLKPVTTRHPVAGPIVEILMGNDGLNALIAGVRRRFRMSEDAGRVEYIQSFVFHRPHVEVIHRDNHENVEVVLTTEALLVPGHRALQGIHGVIALIDVVRLGENLQHNVATRHSDKAVLDHCQIASNQREQIARLGKWIFPGHAGTSIVQYALINLIAVGQQRGKLLAIGNDRRSEACHHIGPIEVVGYLAKPFCFALRTVHRATAIQPFQRGVQLRFGSRHTAHVALSRQCENGQAVVVLTKLIPRQLAPVDLDR